MGHQDGTAYGVQWKEDAGRSDVRDVCGSHPAVRGWDLFRLEIGEKQNGDGVEFDLICRRIQEAHQAGAIDAISWHVDNPVSGGDAWDTSPAVEHVLPGGSHHAVFRVYVDRLADFLQSLRGDQGELIPILLRPLHEHDGGWLWWGSGHTSDEGYVALWRFTVDYLRQQRGRVHLLFAFSPGSDAVRGDDDYLYRYPGDNYVDVFGLDHYYDDDASGLLRGLRIAVRAAQSRGKVAALTEFGRRHGLSGPKERHWVSRSFFDPIVNDPVASRIAYALAWRNAGTEHLFLPYRGHPGAVDLRRVCDDPRLLLERGLTGSGPSGVSGPRRQP